MPDKIKRILTDIAGYLLILLGIASGWLPGPGGIPLVLAGLGLLSIHNEWARRLRDWIVHHSGQVVEKIFPKDPRIQAAYDIVVVLLLGLVAWLAWRHAAIWQISLATMLFFIALLIAGINRDRFETLKSKITGSKTSERS
jgi:hypothetical protein